MIERELMPTPDPRLTALALLRRLQLGQPSATDPQGSYTGAPLWGDVPVQDVDDL